MTAPAGCWREIDASAGGSLARWLRDQHSDDLFERAITERVHEWFGVTAAV